MSNYMTGTVKAEQIYFLPLKADFVDLSVSKDILWQSFNDFHHTDAI